MGNAQSAEEPRKLEKAPRQQNRLSKPRTSASSSNLLLSGPPIPSTRWASGTDVSEVSMVNNKRNSTGTLLDFQNLAVEYVAKTKEKKRMSLFRSKSSQPQAPPQFLRDRVEYEEPVIGGPAVKEPGPMDRYSMGPASYARTQSRHQIRQPRATRRNTTQYMPHSRVNKRLSQVIEVRTPEPNLDDVSKQLRLSGYEAWKGQEEWKRQSVSSQPVSRRQSMTTQTERRQSLTSQLDMRQSSGSQVDRRQSITPQMERRQSLAQSTDRRGSLSQYPIAHSSPDLASMIPIRRRSLLQPGIATRASSVDDKNRNSYVATSPISGSFPGQASFSFSQEPQERWNGQDGRSHISRSQTLPSEAELNNYYHHSTDPTFSPSESLAAIAARPTLPRTETPTDADYRHIGGFKLGSLRITNGAASPAATVRSSRTPGRKVSPEEYFPGKEQDHVAEESQQGRGYDSDSGTFHRESRPRALKQEPQQDWFSPNVEAVKNGPYAHLYKQEVPVPRTPSPQIVETTIQIPAPDHSLSLFRFSDSPIRDVDPKSPTRAYEYAQHYMHEISASPFSFEESLPNSPQLEATSKHTAMEDELFEDDDVNSPGRRTSIEPESRFAVKTVTKSVTQAPNTRPSQLLAKADSGYSSTASLKSSRSRKAIHEISEKPAVPAKTAPPTPPKIFPSSTYSRSSQSPVEKSRENSTHEWCEQAFIDMPSQPSRLPPPVPMKEAPASSEARILSPRPELPPKSSTQEAAAVHSRTHSLSQPHPHPRPDVLRARQSMPAVPTTRPLYLPGHHSSGSDTSGSTSSTSSFKKRLQRVRRGSTSEKLTTVDVPVQTQHVISPSRVPGISHNMEESLAQRLSSFPVGGPTFMKRSNSKETLATIFSMGSMEVSAAETAAAEAQLRELEREKLKIRELAAKELLDASCGRTVVRKEVTKASVANEVSEMREVRKQSVREAREVTRKPLNPPTRGRNPERSQDMTSEREANRFSSLKTVPAPRPQNFINGLAAHPVNVPAPEVESDEKFKGMSSTLASQFARDRSEHRRSVLHRQSLDTLDDKALVSGRLGRSRSTGVDAPPVPVLPTSAFVKDALGSAGIRVKSAPPVTMSTRSQTQTQAPTRKAPQVPTAAPAKPSRAEIVSELTTELDLWEEQRLRWRERRQSAGEGLAATSSTSANVNLGGRKSMDSFVSERSKAPQMKRTSIEDLPSRRSSPNLRGSAVGQTETQLQGRKSRENVRGPGNQNPAPTTKFVPTRPPPQASARYKNMEANFLARTAVYGYGEAQIYGKGYSGKFQQRYQYQNENSYGHEHEDNGNQQHQTETLTRQSFESLSYSAHPRIAPRRASNGSMQEHYTASSDSQSFNTNPSLPPPKRPSANNSPQMRKLSMDKLATFQRRNSPLRTTVSQNDIRTSRPNGEFSTRGERTLPLVLDRYSGGLGMGFGNAFGTGLKNGWEGGLDFSDVQVRVGGRG